MKVLAIKLQIYLLGNKARHIIDNTFDEIYKQACLHYITDPTFFSFPVFVIYKTDQYGRRKNHVIVDIRKLNKLVPFISYLFPLQLEIIANMQSCINLTILDAVPFFYQWRPYSNHSFIFTVIIYHGQETF